MTQLASQKASINFQEGGVLLQCVEFPNRLVLYSSLALGVATNHNWSVCCCHPRSSPEINEAPKKKGCSLSSVSAASLMLLLLPCMLKPNDAASSDKGSISWALSSA